MISAADFPDVFPWMAERKLHQEGDKPTEFSKLNRESQWDYFMCIAQWEDDGGNAWNPFPAASES